MIARRGFLIGAGLLAGAAGRFIPGLPKDGDLAFDVSRNDCRIGSHTLRFTRTGDMLRVDIDAEFAVGFGPIILFRYKHTGAEIWQNGQFASLETKTNDNGTHRQVSARRQANGILIKATGEADRVAPLETLPLTHWAIAAMSAPVFNPETGKAMAEQARHLGPSSVQLADGAKIAATRFSLMGEAQIQDWYDSAEVWAGLQAKAKDGSTVEYRRT